MGFYLTDTRYYDSAIGRFINIDGEISDIGGNILGYNLFTYCFNNPVNMNDPTGRWPKWLSGASNIIGGVAQMAAGVALGTFASWTGIGAVAAGVLIVNGAATVTKGIGQVVNDVTKSNVLREDNIVKTAVKDIGYGIGGETGSQVAGVAYDVAIVAASLYAGRVWLQQAGRLPIKVNISSLTPDPTNPMTDAGINYWTKTLSQNGFKGYNSLPNAYGLIEPICVQKGTMMITNGHHRVEVLAKYGVKTIEVFLVP